MSPPLIAVDGGNSKTELALLRGDGEVLSLVRGPFSSPHHLGLAGALDVIDGLLDQAAADAGLEPSRPLAVLASMQLAGLDLPSEVRAFEQAARRRDWADELLVGNDTFALLRAGSERGWGSQSFAAPGSTASVSRRTAGMRGFRHSATSAATGAVATTWASPPSPPPRGARTAVARARGWRASFLPTSDYRHRSSWRRRCIWSTSTDAAWSSWLPCSFARPATTRSRPRSSTGSHGRS